METSFNVPGGTLKLGSTYRGYVETSFRLPPDILKLEKLTFIPPPISRAYTPNMIIADFLSTVRPTLVRARDDLTLFCDIYNVFLRFLIDFFVLNSNPMCASLKNLSIFVDSKSKVNLKVKYDFSRNEARNKCNTSFLCDFDWAIHFWNYFDNSRSSSRSKGQFQGQVRENISFNK